MNSTNRRDLLKSAAFGAAVSTAFVAGPDLARAATTNPDWERAKAAYAASYKRLEDYGSGPCADAESRTWEINRARPEVTIAYIDPGFTNGAVTIAALPCTKRLTSENYRDPYLGKEITETAEYASFCRDMEAWENNPERQQAVKREAETQAEWSRLFEVHKADWHALAAFPATTAAMLAEKITLLKDQATDDPDWLQVIVDAVARDLTVIGRGA